MSTRDNDKDMLGRKFEAFFLLYFPKVKDVAMKFLKSECEAEDIAQDIFVKLWSKPHLWNNNDDTRPIDGYLFSTTRNHVLNAIKRKNIEQGYREKMEKALDPREFSNTESPLAQIYCQEIELLLRLSLAQMPEKRKLVFKMSRFQEMSNKEIAQKLNLSIRTVERHIYLALVELKKSLLLLLFLL